MKDANVAAGSVKQQIIEALVREFEAADFALVTPRSVLDFLRGLEVPEAANRSQDLEDMLVRVKERLEYVMGEDASKVLYAGEASALCEEIRGVLG